MIQSSGTGKSRTVHEVATLIVTLPLNIRSGTTDLENGPINGYPAEDTISRDYLIINGSLRRERAQAKQLAFLIKLFETASQKIAEMHPERAYTSEASLAADWRNYLEAQNRGIRNMLHSQAVQVFFLSTR